MHIHFLKAIYIIVYFPAILSFYFNTNYTVFTLCLLHREEKLPSLWTFTGR